MFSAAFGVCPAVVLPLWAGTFTVSLVLVLHHVDPVGAVLGLLLISWFQSAHLPGHPCDLFVADPVKNVRPQWSG